MMCCVHRFSSSSTNGCPYVVGKSFSIACVYAFRAFREPHVEPDQSNKRLAMLAVTKGESFNGTYKWVPGVGASESRAAVVGSPSFSSCP